MSGSFERRATRGFTLIELALVLFILGILATLAAPAISVLGGARLDSEARRLAAVISYLHDEAALRGRVYRLSFDFAESTYAVAVAEPKTGEFVSPRSAAGWDPYAPESRVLGEGVRLIELSTAAGPVNAGLRSVYFLPEDARESFQVVLEGAAGAARTLDADGVTGRVSISRTDGAR
jgi:prepilin-type N-terminal cleavage/methylation domain-containing protein